MNFDKLRYHSTSNDPREFKYDKLALSKLAFHPTRDDYESIQYDNFHEKLQQDEISALELFTSHDNDHIFKNENSKKDALVPIEDQNLAEITLPGYLIKLLRNHGKMAFQNLQEEVTKIYESLRKSDGTKYEGDRVKAIRGCLTSSDIFANLGNNVWSLREDLAKGYEDKTTEKLKKLIFKKTRTSKKDAKRAKAEQKEAKFGGESEGSHIANDNTIIGMNTATQMPPVESNVKMEDNNHNMTKLKKRYRRKKEKYELVYGVLDNCTKALKSNGSTVHLLKNPFKGLNGKEGVEEMWPRLGGDKAVGILQCFEYFSPLIEDALELKSKKENKGTKMQEKDIKSIMEGINLITKKMNLLENEIKKNP